MLDVEKLRELLARVESAEEGGGALDLDICSAFGMVMRWSHTDYGSTAWWEWPDGKIVSDEKGRVTSSIDAAVAFCDRVLPGKGWTVTNKPVPEAWIFDETEQETGEYVVENSINEKAASPALALCAAAIRGKIAELESVAIEYH